MAIRFETAHADFAALFGGELAQAALDMANAQLGAAVCGKCGGSGKFISAKGRVVGKCFACNGTGEAKAPIVAAKAPISVEKIEASFAAARQNGIKFPRLRLDAFMFSRASDNGRNAGSLYVKRGDTYLGKVSGGQFIASSECDDETAGRIISVATDPAAAATAYGFRTGECSCCGRTLTNKLSIDLGIGPICRSKFGW